uniref:Uncharacterized protein n=1 Tax=uncultured marine virus TaxID=186617 RepID=A0A0F7L8Q9_9VIRU|nr:hypothetical protein [uncultured marine virus]
MFKSCLGFITDFRCYFSLSLFYHFINNFFPNLICQKAFSSKIHNLIDYILRITI